MEVGDIVWYKARHTSFNKGCRLYGVVLKVQDYSAWVRWARAYYADNTETLGMLETVPKKLYPILQLKYPRLAGEE